MQIKSKSGRLFDTPSDVTEYFRRSGRGWQTRMNEVLQEYISSHR